MARWASHWSRNPTASATPYSNGGRTTTLAVSEEGRLMAVPASTEGTGLEPVRACAQRFSRPPPYQLGLALPGLRWNLRDRLLPQQRDVTRLVETASRHNIGP